MGTSYLPRGLLAALLPPLLACCGGPSFSPAAGDEPGLEQIRQEVELHHHRAAAATSLEELRAELDRYELAVGGGIEVLRDEVATADCSRQIPAMTSMVDGLLEVIAAHRDAIEGVERLTDAKANCQLHHDAMLARIEQLDSQTASCGEEVEHRARG